MRSPGRKPSLSPASTAGTREDDALDLAVLEGAHRQRDGHVGLTGTCRADGEDKVVLEVGGHQVLLRLVAGADGLAVRAVHDDGVRRRAGLSVVAGEDVLHVIDREVHLAVTAVHQFGKPDVELCDVALAAVQDEFVAAGHYLQMRKVGAEFGKDFIAHPIDFDGVDGFKRDRFLHTGTKILQKKGATAWLLPFYCKEGWITGRE